MSDSEGQNINIRKSAFRCDKQQNMGDNLNDCTHTLDEIYAAFKDHDAIYIAHFHQKKPAIPLEDAEKLDEMIQDPHDELPAPKKKK